MLMETLKKEYEFRHNIMQYKKLQKLYIYSCYEKNNYNLIVSVIEEMNY